MQRIHFYLPVKLIAKLRAQATREGVSLAEVVRNILAAHFNA